MTDTPAPVTGEMIADPIERIVATALSAAGIAWEHGSPHRLDFYLPDFVAYIECKQFATDRTLAQIAPHENVILIHGRQAARAFAGMLTLLTSARSAHAEEMREARLILTIHASNGNARQAAADWLRRHPEEAGE